MIIHVVLISTLFILATLTEFVGFYVIFFVIFTFYAIELFAVFTAPFVSIPKNDLKTMIRLADIKSGMKVYDLGAGEGVLIREAAKKGADALGYEISVGAYLLYLLKKIFLKQKGRVVWGDLWKKDVSDADVIFCYLMPHAMKKFEKTKFSTMKKGSRVVSKSFKMPNVKPDKIENNIYLYIRK